MLSSIAHRITGFAIIKVSGVDKERFVNLAIKSGIRFWHSHREEESYVLSLRGRDFKYLRPIKRRCRVKITVLDKKGLPFLIMPYKKRFGIVIGIITGIVMVCLMSGQVWVLTASGSVNHSDREILAAAKSAGIDVGTKYEDFDATSASNKIQLILGDVKWVSVNTDGVHTDIAVRDSDPKPPSYTKTGVWNIVARETGIVRYVEAQDGMISVMRDEGVAKGQVLISGIWETYNKWGEKTGNTFMAGARGKVLAETRHSFNISIPLTETEYEQVGKENKRTLNFFGITIPLGFFSPPKGTYKKESTEDALWLMGTKMPISIKKDVYIRVEPKEKEIADEELKTKLDKLLAEKAAELMGEDCKILSAEKKYTKIGNNITLEADCTCLENIGVEKEVLFD